MWSAQKLKLELVNSIDWSPTLTFLYRPLIVGLIALNEFNMEKSAITLADKKLGIDLTITDIQKGKKMNNTQQSNMLRQHKECETGKPQRNAITKQRHSETLRG